MKEKEEECFKLNNLVLPFEKTVQHQNSEIWRPDYAGSLAAPIELIKCLKCLNRDPIMDSFYDWKPYPCIFM